MGTDKAWLEIGGQPMLARIAGAVAGVGPVFIANGDGSRELPPVGVPAELVRDAIADQGPLAGFLAIANALPEHVTRVFVCGCDLPFVTPEIVRSIDEHWQNTSRDAVVPEIAGRLEPLVAVYGRPSFARIADAFAAGQRRLTDVVATLEPERVSEADLQEVDPDLAAFLNLNRPEDYERALSLLDPDAPRA